MDGLLIVAAIRTATLVLVAPLRLAPPGPASPTPLRSLLSRPGRTRAGPAGGDAA